MIKQFRNLVTKNIQAGGASWGTPEKGPLVGFLRGKTRDRTRSSGQALVALLVFTVVTITLASAAIVIVLVNSTRAQTVEQGTITRTLAENGIENALIRLLRDPAYSGETLTSAEGDAIVEVVAGAGNIKTITSRAQSRGFVREIQVVVDTTNYQINIQSWKQTY